MKPVWLKLSDRKPKSGVDVWVLTKRARRPRVMARKYDRLWYMTSRGYIIARDDDRWTEAFPPELS